MHFLQMISCQQADYTEWSEGPANAAWVFHHSTLELVFMLVGLTDCTFRVGLPASCQVVVFYLRHSGGPECDVWRE